jgi:molybdopterin synthase catalytic subunit
VDTPEVAIQAEDFDTRALQALLTADTGATGALVSFVGLVRSEADQAAVLAMELEHYPGMTESSIQQIIDQARQRWDILQVKVVHRIGRLLPGEQIVYVGVSSRHRGTAFLACEFIMDYLKTRAPFWKKEKTQAGSRWVDARETDTAAASRWQASPE